MTTDHLYLGLIPMIRPLVRIAARKRLAHFRAAPSRPGQIVLLGDSITEQGLWDAWLPDFRTINRGIGGDTTSDVLDRLTGTVDRPAVVSLLIGTNDLHGSRAERDIAGIAARTRTILERLQDAAPGSALLLHSVLPRTAYFAPRIRALNAQNRTTAAALGIDYVDVWPALADRHGALRRECTDDNLHLTPAGYQAWTELLAPRLLAAVRDAPA